MTPNELVLDFVLAMIAAWVLTGLYRLCVTAYRRRTERKEDDR